MMVKFIPFLFIFFLITLRAKASDTLTVRQAYNFSVGDTFDYKYQTINDDFGWNFTNYGRKVLIQKTVSVTLDTIFYGFGGPLSSQVSEWDTITNLDSISIRQISIDTSICRGQYQFISSIYPGHMSNTVQVSCFEVDTSYTFTEGLGRTQYYYGQPDYNGGGCDCYGEQLVYFSNGTTSVGTPYYLLLGVGLKKIALHIQIQLFPNPVANKCTLQLNGNSEPLSASVLDITGREILSLFTNRQISLFNFSTKDLSPGVYVVRVTDFQGKQEIVKLIKQ
jgi:hypothetical protein